MFEFLFMGKESVFKTVKTVNNICMAFQFIYGEIYEVDDRMLEHLDELERCPKWYTRRVVIVQQSPEIASKCSGLNHVQAGEEQTVTCFIYVISPDKINQDIVDFETSEIVPISAKKPQIEGNLQDIMLTELFAKVFRQGCHN